MKKKMALQTLEETKRRDDTSPDPKRSKHHLTAPWNLPGSTSPGSTVAALDTQDPKISLKLDRKQKQFGPSDQLLCVKIPEEDLVQKHTQLFWGLPSLHSESIMATLLVPKSSYSPEHCLVFFNGICKVAAPSAGRRGLPALPQPQTLPEGKAQAHVHSPLSTVALPSLPCGSALQISPTEAVSDVLNEKEHSKYHLLQNPQDDPWGLVRERQRYKTAFLPVHSFPLGDQPSQTYVSIPRSGLFHFSSEHQNNLDPYGSKNLILPWCFKPCGRTGVKEMMDTQLKPTGASSHGYNYAKPKCCTHWGKISPGSGTGDLSHSKSFYGKVPMKPQLKTDVAKNLGQILGKCPLNNPQMISGCYILDSLKAVPETDGEWAYRSRTALENGQLSISRKNLDQRHARSILRLHMSRKYWQITMDRIPIEVCWSWLAEDTSLGSSPLGKSHCNTSLPKISFLDCNIQKMLEAHLIRLRVSQQWGLPIRVIESNKFFILREAKTWPLPQSDLPLSLNSIPGLGLKSNFPSPLRGSFTNLLHGDQMETEDSAPTSDYSLTLSCVDSEGEGSLRQSVSSPASEVTEMVQIVEDMGQTEAVLQSRPREEQPRKKDVVRSESALYFKKHMLKELRSKLENQPQSQPESWENETSLALDSLSSYSISSSNSMSSADVSVFRDTQGHVYNTAISVGSWQETSVFKRVLKNFTPSEKRLALPAPQKQNGRSDPWGLETSKAGKKRQPIKEKPDKKHPPDSYFRKKIGQFFQWLYSSKDSTRHRSEKDRALFMSCGPPEAHELMASLGKLLEDKLLGGQKSEFLEWGQKKTLPAQPELQGQPANLGAANTHHGEAASDCSCPQTSRMLSLGRRQQCESFEHPPSDLLQLHLHEGVSCASCPSYLPQAQW